MKEVFKDIPGYEGYYQASNLGNIKSVSRVVGHNWGGTKRTKEKILSIAMNKGYGYVSLSKDGNNKMYSVHQLVAMAFLNHTPNGHDLVVDHIDENPLNNNLDNLQVISQAENVRKSAKNSSGCIGVYQKKDSGKWYSQLNRKHLGYFNTKDEAIEAYDNALRKEVGCENS
jgi:hypothetical protein